MSLRRVGFTAVPPGPKPGFDHADTHLAPGGSRLYVAHTGADRVDVLDCRSGEYLRSFTELPGVAGVLIDRDLLFTSDRAAARVSVFALPRETLVAEVSVDPRPNGLAFDRRERRLFSFNLGDPPGTGCTASVVSIDDQRVVATIGLPGRPRWGAFDAATRAVYVNIADPPVIAVIDADTLRVHRTIDVPAAGPHGLALVRNGSHASLWCAADGAALVVLDRDSGKMITSLPLVGTPDVVMYDEGLRRIYVAVGFPGTVTVFDTRGRREIGKTTTEDGAHTIGWDPASRRLFVFQPKSCGVAIYDDAA